MGVGRFAFTPILPMMQTLDGVSIQDGGWLAAANYFGYLLGALTAARMSLSQGAVARAGLALVCVATVGMGVLSGFALWLILRMIAGVASAWILVFGSAWAMQRLAAAAAPMLSGVVFAGVGLGIACVGLVCMALAQAGATTAQTWMVVGALAFVASALIWPAFRSRQTSAPRVAPPAQSALISWGRSTIAYGLFGFGYIVPATFLPSMARDALGDPAYYGWSWPLFGFAAMLSTLAAAPFARRFGARRVWMAAQTAMALGVGAPLVVSGGWGVMMSALTVGATFMVVTMAGIQEAREAGGEHGTRLVARMTAAFALGQLAGPLLVSAVVPFGDPYSIVVPLAALALLAGAYLIKPAPDPKASNYGARA
jgi:MFS family permease